MEFLVGFFSGVLATLILIQVLVITVLIKTSE